MEASISTKRHEEEAAALRCSLTSKTQEAELRQTDAISEVRRTLLASVQVEREEIYRAHASTLKASEDVGLELRSELAKHVSQTLATEAAHQSALTAAVAEAKQKVYAKAKAQFEAGNKEFVKVKAERDAKAAEADGIAVALVLSQKKHIEESEKAAAATTRVSDLRTFLFSIGSAVGLSVSDIAGFEANGATGERAFALSAQDTALSMSRNLAEALSNKESLRAAMSILESSLRKTESALAVANDKALKQEERAAVSEALLSGARVELVDTQRERDSQMMAVAKLFTDKASLQEKLEESEQQAVGLRQMNEEVMSMLEKLYSEKAAPSSS